MIDKALGDIDSHIQDTVEMTIVDFMETVDIDHNKHFMKNVLGFAMQDMFRSLMDGENLWEAFEAAVTQVATSTKMVDAIWKSIDFYKIAIAE